MFERLLLLLCAAEVLEERRRNRKSQESGIEHALGSHMCVTGSRR